MTLLFAVLCGISGLTAQNGALMETGWTEARNDSDWPKYDEKWLKEDVVTYSISFNGKTRFTMDFPTDATREEIQDAVLANKRTQKYIDGKNIRKVIVVPHKIVNIVL